MTYPFDVVHGLAELDPSVWYDNATHFNCTEAERIADFLGAFVSHEVAIEFLSCHAEDDDGGDQHVVIYSDDNDPDPFHVPAYPVGVASRTERDL